MQTEHDIQHLAILMPSWLGDVVMSSCIWKMARRTYPNAKITAVIRPHLAPILDGIDAIDEVLSLDMKASVFAAAKQLKSIEADAIVLLPNSFRSALIAKLSGIKQRWGYKRDWRTWLLTRGVDVQKQMRPTPTTEYYLHVANTLFGLNETDALPTLGTQLELPEVVQKLSHPLVLFVAGASKEQKRWSPENFARTADALSEVGMTCACIGSPDEYELVQEVVLAATAPIHNLTRSGIALGSLPTVIAHADLVITNDTGPRHLSIAVGTPVITLYGPTDFRWTQYQCDTDIALLADPFLPIELVADSNQDRCNINNIPPSDVIACALKFLK